jgi:hypothetical protein
LRTTLRSEAESVFKIATADTRVRGYLTANGWEACGRSAKMEMDSYRNKKTGNLLYVEDISEDFPVTFIMGQLGLGEFRRIAHDLNPETELLTVESSWEGKATTIVVAMSEDQVRSMFGKKTRMWRLEDRRVAPRV